jgi:hypothetical protein
LPAKRPAASLRNAISSRKLRVKGDSQRWRGSAAGPHPGNGGAGTKAMAARLADQWIGCSVARFGDILAARILK